MGSDDAIAAPLLHWLKDNEGQYTFEGIVTQPDKPVGRGQQIEANPIAAWGKANGVRVQKPEKPGPEEVAWFKEVDLVLVLAYGHLLKTDLLEAPRLPMLNFHGSILPKYRGASPIHGALLAGETITGITLMRMVKKMDAGPMLDTETVAIGARETLPSLKAKLAQACVPLLARNLDNIFANQLTWKEQDEASATYTRKIQKSDGQLDFTRPAVELERAFRAYQPWPGSFFEHKGVLLKVWDCFASSQESGAAPGTLSVGNDAVAIQTARGTLHITEIQKPGGKRLPVREFSRGFAW